MATGATDGSVRLWAVADPTTPKLLATLNNGRNAVTALEFSPDATRLTTAGKDLSVTQWDVSDPASPQSLGVVSDKSSRCLARTAEGSLALAEGGSLRLLGSPEPSEGATGHDGHILSLAAASRRNLLVSGGSDGTARLWRVENGSDLRQVSILTDHRGGVHGVALSPDDTLIATAGEDRTLRLWDIRDQGEPKRVATVPHPEGLRAVTISATGQLLAVSDVNGNVHLYWLT
jgi:WD40 repeat protein